jgi:hypothetical protein
VSCAGGLRRHDGRARKRTDDCRPGAGRRPQKARRLSRSPPVRVSAMAGPYAFSLLSGNVKVKVEPIPSWLLTQIFPP